MRKHLAFHAASADVEADRHSKGVESMKLLEVSNFDFNRVELNWQGPFPWDREGACPSVPRSLLDEPGIYRAETAGRGRKMIRYIGSASEYFGQRLTSRHRIKTDLVNRKSRPVQVFLATIHPERRLRLLRRHYVEIEYILQNVHSEDLLSWHGIGKLPKTSRGEGWHIVNKGMRGPLSRVVAYPAFAVSGRDS